MRISDWSSDVCSSALYDPDWTPNTTDAHGRRYRFGWQPKVAHWNLGRLAQALSPLFGDVQPLQDGLDRYAAAYERSERETTAHKLGLAECRDGDVELIGDLYALMQAAEIDMTLWFRALAGVDVQAPSLAPMSDAFYDPVKQRESEAALMAWLARYAARLRDDPLTPRSEEHTS